MKKLIFAFLLGILLLFVAKKFLFDFVWKSKEEEVTITIFVHGSRPAGFFARSSVSKSGLHGICEYDPTSYYCTVAEGFKKQSETKYSDDHFYIFGWPGSISFVQRKKMAKKLYEDTKKLLEQYQQESGIYPTIQIVTFSHGGNIALYLAEHLPFFEYEDIELNLVLIGCPIQATTEELASSPYFNHISILSSRGDVVQCIDPQNLYGPRRDKKTYFFSRRFLDFDDLNDDAKQKVVQCAITVNKQTIGHADMSRAFMAHVPRILEQCAKKVSDTILDIDVFDPDFVYSPFYVFF